jgi:methionyl aminopeptidase
MPSLDDEAVRDYRRAGKIAKEALAIARASTKEGALAIDVANKVEKHIRDSGAACAFPINICSNNVAAHYTPTENDKMRFSKGDLVKLDVGVHVNGRIADTAITVEISTSNWADLIGASEDALDCALEMLVPGIGVSALGSAIDNAISSRGFNPVRNLTGHSLEQYILHAGITVPNVPSKDKSLLTRGMAVAIEPFATDGKGAVDGNKGGNIYQVIGDRKLSDNGANQFLESITGSFSNLPFASRWCSGLSKDYESLIKKHWRHRNVRSYSILAEKTGSMVSQAEHSALIMEDEIIIYTK